MTQVENANRCDQQDNGYHDNVNVHLMTTYASGATCALSKHYGRTMQWHTCTAQEWDPPQYDILAK